MVPSLFHCLKMISADRGTLKFIRARWAINSMNSRASLGLIFGSTFGIIQCPANFLHLVIGVPFHILPDRIHVKVLSPATGNQAGKDVSGGFT